MKEIYASLNLIQSELDAPKNQVNSFGKYKYRSCEDILAAVKPLLEKTGTTLTLNDEMVEVGGRVYVKAVASLCLDGQCISTTAFAREAENKKGMDESQITGATSSYARKYALNGLFCIDDAKDSDATNTGKVEKITDKQLGQIRDMLIEANAKEEPLCKYLGVENLEDMISTDFSKAKAAIEARKNNGHS